MRNTSQSLVAMIPETSIPEIQEVREEMKKHVGDNFFPFYTSKLNLARSKIEKKLSRGYVELFNKAYNDGYVAEHNPFENPVLAITKTQDRIVKGWRAVEQQKNRMIKGLADIKVFLIPVAESKTFAETEKALANIPYDAKYFPTEGGFHRVPYFPPLGDALLFPKFETEAALVAMLNEMRIYEEKDMLMELVPLVRKVDKNTIAARKEAMKRWEEKHPRPLHRDRSRGWGVARHNATGHLTAGICFNTEQALKNIKTMYPDI